MPKLPKGMFPRGSSYYTRVYRGGRDRWVSLGSEYGEACRKLSAIRGGELAPASRFTVEQAAERWLDTYAATERSARYRGDTRSRVRRMLVPFMGHKLMARLAGDDFRAYRVWLERRGLAPETVRHALSDARCMVRWCTDSGLVDRSPFPRRIMPRIERRPPDRLTSAEVDALLDVGEPHAFVIRLGLGTGMRWGELCRAQAAHVDRDMLLVPRSKTGEFRRVPFSSDLLREVRGRVGRLVPFTSAGSFAKAVRRRSGVDRFHVHQLRHTFACRWLEDGRAIAALKEILGHKSITTTERYAGLAEEFVRAEAARPARGER